MWVYLNWAQVYCNEDCFYTHNSCPWNKNRVKYWILRDKERERGRMCGCNCSKVNILLMGVVVTLFCVVGFLSAVIIASNISTATTTFSILNSKFTFFSPKSIYQRIIWTSCYLWYYLVWWRWEFWYYLWLNQPSLPESAVYYKPRT